jgi:hypothetical protein
MKNFAHVNEPLHRYRLCINSHLFSDITHQMKQIDDESMCIITIRRICLNQRSQGNHNVNEHIQHYQPRPFKNFAHVNEPLDRYLLSVNLHHFSPISTTNEAESR